MGRPAGFFDVEERLAGLSKKGDDHERLAAVVDFELFRPELERAVPRAERSKGGRPPFDHVLMFKVLILQTQNNLSDERTEFYLRDRLTWMRFLGLGLGDAVPDANTIWTFREALTGAGAIERLFELFDRELRAAGYLAMSGQLVDATIVAAPKQRNTSAEKQAIRAGRVPAAPGLCWFLPVLVQPGISRCAVMRQPSVLPLLEPPQGAAPHPGRSIVHQPAGVAECGVHRFAERLGPARTLSCRPCPYYPAIARAHQGLGRRPKTALGGDAHRRASRAAPPAQ